MPTGSDNHRKPTTRRSSDNLGARPHETGSQHEGKPSLSEQLLSAARGQDAQSAKPGGAAGAGKPQGGSSQPSGPRQSLSEQLLASAREQQASAGQAPSGHATGGQGASPHAGQGSSPVSGFTQTTQQAAPGSGGGRQGSGFSLPKSGIGAVAVLLILFLLGGSCMSGLGDLGGSGGSGGSGGGGTSGSFTTSATPGANGYTISQDLGAGDAGDTWTVLMYVCGSNLESTSTRTGGGLATSNLVELAQVDLGSNVNYLVETGGAKRWQNNVVSARYLERYHMEQGGLAREAQLPSASMAEPSTLADFISWGAKAYPADHYMLVIWDHGGGSIAGVCNDDLFPYTRSGEADSLTLAELRDALKAGGVKFDVVGFDTCLMATLETAEILQPYASYMVASEETEPGTGWDYSAWPAWLAKHPGTSGADLGTVICETYYNKCANVNVARTATLSTIDLSKIKAVSDAFRNVSDDIAYATVDSASLRRLHQGAGKSESYGNDGGGIFSTSMNMVDLGDLMNQTRDVLGADADAVVSAVSDAVVFQTHGRNRSKASGLSVFYPLQARDRNDFYRYAEISSNTPYLQFLGVMYGMYEKYDWTQFSDYVSLRGEPVNENNVKVAFEQTVNPDGHLQLKVTQGLDQVAMVHLEMYVSLPEIETLCLIGTDNDLHGTYDEGVFTDNFQNDWLTVDGNYVSAVLTEQGDGYNLYYIPVNVNGERTGLLVEYDFSTNEYAVVCAWDENDQDTGMAGRTGRVLEDGDEVQFLFPSLNTSTGEQSFIPLATMSWHDDPTIVYESLGDGTYAFRYVVTDILGNEQKGDLVFERYENDAFAGMA